MTGEIKFRYQGNKCIFNGENNKITGQGTVHITGEKSSDNRGRKVHLTGERIRKRDREYGEGKSIAGREIITLD